MIKNAPALSPRLTAILQVVNGKTLADIGTDHAYLPIAACLQKKIKNAIACDLHPKPLQKADENIRAYALENSIESRLGDGLSPIKPGEADVITMSGMGGMKIIEILSENPDTARKATKLILQPQHDIIHLRKFLHESYFDINEEYIIKEENRFYFIFLTSPVDYRPVWTEKEYRWGKILIKKNTVVWKEYLENERDKMNRYIYKANPDKTAELKKYIAEVQEFGS